MLKHIQIDVDRFLVDLFPMNACFLSVELTQKSHDFILHTLNSYTKIHNDVEHINLYLHIRECFHNATHQSRTSIIDGRIKE